MFEAPGVNVDAFDAKFDSPELSAAWCTDDRPRTHWFDAELGTIQTQIDKAVTNAVGDRMATIVSYSRGRSRKVIHIGGSNDPGRYYVFDQTDVVMKLFYAGERKTEALAAYHDNLFQLQGARRAGHPSLLYVAAGAGARSLPLVILHHGGPYDIRDDGTYDAEVQFLANRGYAVLQPENRGSGGYGRAFDKKGEGQCGRAMQDDLDDGMDWLAKQGTIDPKRVCIVGSSYGGHAAMWGAIRNPERYRCAARFAGVSDLKRRIKYANGFFRSQR